jgi:GH15 family glucan-1,4-alpha-glucosidase
MVFPSYPGAVELDASALLFVLEGFVGGDDPRARALISCLESDLGFDDHLLRRWSGAPDSPFLLCSYWLVEALVMTGQAGRGAELLGRLDAYRNDLGLLPEEVEPGSGAALGNVPLAISHAGYVCAAMRVHEALSPRATTMVDSR